ncbi:Protein of unknown function [Gryllus bimaculatus]|nr:Protein of unknown function [Gryllus bimaculatus]
MVLVRVNEASICTSLWLLHGSAFAIYYWTDCCLHEEFCRTVEAHSFGDYFGVWVTTLHIQGNLIVCVRNGLQKYSRELEIRSVRR